MDLHGKNDKHLCHFRIVTSFCTIGRCIRFDVLACYKKRRPYFIIYSGCCNIILPSYNLHGVKSNFTKGYYMFLVGSYKLANDSYNFTNSSYKLTKGCYNFAKGCFINQVADYVKLLVHGKSQGANHVILGASCTEYGLDVGFNGD